MLTRLRSLEQLMPFATAGELIAEKLWAVMSENVEIASGPRPWNLDRMATLC